MVCSVLYGASLQDNWDMLAFIHGIKLKGAVKELVTVTEGINKIDVNNVEQVLHGWLR